MLGASRIGNIRRALFRVGRSIKRISRCLDVSRATVLKVLRSGETAFAHERRTLPKIGPWQSGLDGILTERIMEGPLDSEGRRFGGGHD